MRIWRAPSTGFVLAMFAPTLAYSEIVFWELGVFQVAIITLLYMLIPLGIGLFVWSNQPPPERTQTAIANSSPLSQSLAALLVFSLTLLSLEPFWDNFYPGLPFENLARGLGFHQDTAFHAALTRGIMETGFPTLGQFGFDNLEYHFMAHYLDAAVLTMAGLVNPLEAASLLYLLKSIVLATSFVAVYLINGTPRRLNLNLVSIFFVPVVLGSGIAASSPSLWISILLILLWANSPSAIDPQTERNSLIKKVTWLAAVSFAKVSSGFVLGLYFAALEIVNLKASNRLGLARRIGAIFAFAAVPIGISSQMGLSSRLSADFFSSLEKASQILQYGLPYLLASFALGVVGLLLRTDFRNAWFAVLLSVLGVATVTLLPISTSAEEFQFFPQALFFVALGILTSRKTIKTEPVFPENQEESREKRLYRIVGVSAIFLATAPVGLLAPFHPFFSDSEKVVRAISAAESRFIMSQDSSIELSDGSILSELASGERWSRGQSVRFQAFIGAVREVAFRHSERPALILTTEYFKDFEEMTGTAFDGPGNFYFEDKEVPDAWAHGLMFYAATGIPLVYSKPDSIDAFGFQFLPDSQFRKDRQEILVLGCGTLPQSFDYLIFWSLDNPPLPCPIDRTIDH